MISASAVKLGYVDDFWVDSDSFFVNDLWVSSSLCVLTISALAVKLGYVNDF
jgi:hypothetical protein